MERIVKSLFAGDLEMPLSDCVLRQIGVDSPIVYEGPGLITQELDKSIRLRVFAASVYFLETFKRRVTGI